MFTDSVLWHKKEWGDWFEGKLFEKALQETSLNQGLNRRKGGMCSCLSGLAPDSVFKCREQSWS